MWNPKGFQTTTQYVLGNATRTYGELRNPPLYNESVNVRKHFHMGERFQGICKWITSTRFNRTQFQNPDNNASNSTFGQVINKGAQGNMPQNRQGQASFRIEF